MDPDIIYRMYIYIHIVYNGLLKTTVYLGNNIISHRNPKQPGAPFTSPLCGGRTNPGCRLRATLWRVTEAWEKSQYEN